MSEVNPIRTALLFVSPSFYRFSAVWMRLFSNNQAERHEQRAQAQYDGWLQIHSPMAMPGWTLVKPMWVWRSMADF